MPYIGYNVTNAGSFALVDDIASTFNGSNTAFTLQVGGVNITPNVQNLLIAIDGVVQQAPDAYSVSGSTITFTGAPASGADFYGVLMGQSSYVENNSITADELAVSGDGTSGQLLSTDGDGTFSYINQSAVTADANVLSGTTLKSTVVNSSLTSVGTLTGLTSSSDVLITGGNALQLRETDTYINSPSSDRIDFRTSGTLALTVDSSQRVGINYSTPSSMNDSGNNLVIGSGASGDNTGLTIFSNSDSSGSIHFADGTSGDEAYRGIVAYTHSSDAMRFFTSGTEKMRIASDGKIFVGSTSSRALSGVTPQMQIEGTDYSTSSMSLIGNTGTDAGTCPLLMFGRSRGTSDGTSTSVADGDRLGAIFFTGADGTDINTVGAYIEARADGSVSGNTMPGRIVFYTNSGGSSASEKMRITSGGRLGIGITNPDSYHSSNQLVIGNTSGEGTMTIVSNASNDGNLYFADGTASGNITGILRYKHSVNQMEFYTNENLAMELTSGKELTVARGSTGIGGTINAYTQNGRWGIMVDEVFGNDALIDFRDNGSSIGNITIVSGNVSYNTFIGSHYSSLTTDNEDDIEIGTVLSTIDETHTRHLAKFKVSDVVGDTRVYGVFAGWDGMYEGEGTQATISALGATEIRVTGACEGGDLLESNGDGTAKVQSDDIIKSKTIGKVTIGDSDTGVKLVSCVLYCG